MTQSGPVDPLADLRGWHPPEPVSWWPPAPGWWVLAVLILLLVAGLIWWALRRHRARAAARTARLELASLISRFDGDGNSAAFARGLSRLLRRFAIARFPRREVAGLAGTDWLDFLDARGGSGRFRNGPGRLLAEAPYRRTDELPATELSALVRDWIDRNAVRRS